MTRHLWIMLIASMSWCSRPVLGETEVITVNTPNALLSVAKQLGRLYGQGVSFEGPMYEHVDDLVDTERLTKPSRENVENCEASSRINARFCYFTASYDVDPETRAPTSVVAAVRQIVQQYNEGANPGRFVVIETSHGPSIVATRIRSPTGDWKAVSPVLGHPISVGITNLTNVSALNAVLGAIQGAAEVQIVGGSLKQPRGRISLHAENEPARDVLARLLADPEYGGTNNVWFVIQSTCPRLCGFEEHSTMMGPPLRPRDQLPWSMVGNVSHPDYRGEGSAGAASPAPEAGP